MARRVQVMHESPGNFLTGIEGHAGTLGIVGLSFLLC